MEVDVIGDEQDNAVPKEAIALRHRTAERKNHSGWAELS